MFLDSHKEACSLLEQMYPETAKAVSVAQALAPTLTSAHTLTLPKKVLLQAKAAVAAFGELRDNAKYISHVEAERSADLSRNKNYSALMSFDFHLTENHELKLIEINTNASSSLVVDVQYRRAGLQNPLGNDFRETILKTFRNEFALGGHGRELRTIAVIDENPLQQKMYIEFLMYAELFKSSGYKVIVDDVKNFSIGTNNKLVHTSGLEIDLVYNRHTDFYLLQPISETLRKSYQSLETVFSPNPREYALLADKQRLQDFSREGFLESLGISANSISEIRKCLLKTYSLKDFTREEAWAQRKKFFFKPARAFGGKAVYKGASISKGHFENLWSADTVAQEFQQAPEIMLPVDGTEQRFKYDLRFYTYQNTVQLCNARVYQGQTTNATTPGGGLTPIVFN